MSDEAITVMALLAWLRLDKCRGPWQRGSCNRCGRWDAGTCRLYVAPSEPGYVCPDFRAEENHDAA